MNDRVPKYILHKADHAWVLDEVKEYKYDGDYIIYVDTLGAHHQLLKSQCKGFEAKDEVGAFRMLRSHRRIDLLRLQRDEPPNTKLIDAAKVLHDAAARLLNNARSRERWRNRKPPMP